MKVQSLKQQNYKIPTFGDNKVYVYADFDRTISPNTTGDVFYATDQSKIEKAKYNFDLLNDLIAKYKNLSFFIATGRANDELQLMYDLYKRLGVDFVNAHSVITKEGADEFLRDKHTSNDYPYTIQNSTRNRKISQSTGWNKQDIQNSVRKIICSNGLTPLVCGTTLSAEKYGKYSIFSYPEKFDTKTVLVRNIGELKLFLGFTDSIPKQKYINIKNEIIKYLTNHNIDFTILEKNKDRECGNLRTIMFTPIIDGEPISKNFDIKERIKTLDATDTVIVAGDGKNDLSMLNPASYSDDFSGKLLSIIVNKPDEKEPELEELKENFENTDLRKIITINEGDFADTLKQALQNKLHV